MTQLLIDGDLFAYKAASAAEFESNPEGDVWFLSTNLQQAKDMFLSMVESVQRELGSEDVVVVFSGPEDFRRSLSPEYKAGRKNKRKPLGYLALLDFVREHYGNRVVSQECLEADDYMGILATTPNAVERIIVSDDKDMKTIPGRLFRLGGLSNISVDEADANWLLQTLTGDTTDGYKGCPGVGEVKANAILKKPGDRWENVRQAFLKAGMSEDYAVLQARLARILRYEDWDTVAKKPRLWSPTN